MIKCVRGSLASADSIFPADSIKNRSARSISDLSANQKVATTPEIVMHHLTTHGVSNELNAFGLFPSDRRWQKTDHHLQFVINRTCHSFRAQNLGGVGAQRAKHGGQGINESSD